MSELKLTSGYLRDLKDVRNVVIKASLSSDIETLCGAVESLVEILIEREESELRAKVKEKQRG